MCDEIRARAKSKFRCIKSSRSIDIGPPRHRQVRAHLREAMDARGQLFRALHLRIDRDHLQRGDDSFPQVCASTSTALSFGDVLSLTRRMMFAANCLCRGLLNVWSLRKAVRPCASPPPYLNTARVLLIQVNLNYVTEEHRQDTYRLAIPIFFL